MKAYRNHIRIVYWILIGLDVIGILSRYFEEWFPWSTGMYFAGCAAVLPVIVLSPLKYFCGIAARRITDSTGLKRYLHIMAAWKLTNPVGCPCFF